MSKPEVVSLRAYALIAKEGKVLLCRLGPTSDEVGAWTLPGGGGEFGESPQQTCLREVMEETGLQIRITSLAEVNSRLWEDQHSRNHTVRFFFFAEVTAGQLRNEEAGSTDLAAWVNIEDIKLQPRVDLVDLALTILYQQSPISMNGES